MPFVEIINGDHDPPHPFIVCDRFGLHVELADVDHAVFDKNTVRRVIWGFMHQRTMGDGRTPLGPPIMAGRIEFKNGEARLFFDTALMVPYLAAWKNAKAKHDATMARNQVA